MPQHQQIIVPSQIGNIQISQVDRTKSTPNQSGKTATIENQIQITPILDSVKSASAPLAGPTVAQLHAPQSFAHLNNSQAITMNIQANQPMLNIPNNMQIISSVSTNNTLNTHANIITNSMATGATANGGGVILNATQPFQSPIGLQRQSTIQSSPVHTINNQGNLINSSGDQRCVVFLFRSHIAKLKIKIKSNKTCKTPFFGVYTG